MCDTPLRKGMIRDHDGNDRGIHGGQRRSAGMAAVSAPVAILGALLVLATWMSVMRTVFVPREKTSRAARWTTALVAGATLVTARELRGRSRERVLNLCMPVIVVIMASIWFIAATAGFALLAWGIANVPFGARAMGDFFLLRSGDVPLGAVSWLSTVLLATVVTAHLVRLTDAYSRRERPVIRLAAQATSPPDAEAVLGDYLRARTPHHLGSMFARWADWMADIQGTHLGYPELVYYRAAGELPWTGAALIVLDCAALAQACAPGWAPPQTLSLLTVGSRSLQLIAAQLKIVLPPVPVSFQGRETQPFNGTIKKMRLAGLPLERDEESAQAIFQQLRIQYAPFANAIHERLLYESAGEAHELHGSQRNL